MKRLLIMTVGKTHSGKTTFAKELEQHLPGSLVIDQDNHAEFINTFYRNLLPEEGPNTIKTAITRTVVDYATQQTDFHLILCNSNRNGIGRRKLLEEFHKKGFTTILVNFEIPLHILQERVANTKRSPIVFRSASTFEEVLQRQQRETQVSAPCTGEADYLFTVRNAGDHLTILKEIGKISND